MRKRSMIELNRMTTEEFKDSEKIPVVIVLDNIRSQHNIGSVFRTADAFRLEAVYLCGITATPPHREIHKTALGATESVEWKYFDSAADAVKQMAVDACLPGRQGYQIIAVEQAEGSTLLQDFQPDPDQKLAIIFGNEVNGIEEEVLNLADTCLEIPQFGTKHSINISVSVGIVIWDILFKLKKLSIL